MRLESRLYRTVQAERAVRGEHEQYGCPDAHENAHASDLHDMEPMLWKPVPREHVYGTPGISRCRRIWLLGRGAYIKCREAHRVL